MALICGTENDQKEKKKKTMGTRSVQSSESQSLEKSESATVVPVSHHSQKPSKANREERH